MDTIDRQILVALAGDIPLTHDPYGDIAATLQMDKETLLKRLQVLQDQGKLKRIAPILRHHKTGFSYNAMTTWIMEEDRIDAVAEAFSKDTSVSHVYERFTTEDWPYNLYGMVHATSMEEINAIVDRLKILAGDVPYKVVLTEKEWKKTSPDIGALLAEGE